MPGQWSGDATCTGLKAAVLDARRCLAYVLQAPGVIPRSLRRAVGDRIYGCDDCLDACPPGSRLAERSTAPNGNVDLLELLALDDVSLIDAHRHFYIPRRRARYLRRNVLVALGNSEPHPAVPAVLAAHLGHSDWLLRLHAAWALGAIGDRSARGILSEALAEEEHDAVAEELELALST